MASRSERSVFDSPAVALLCELEDAAQAAGATLTARFTPAGRVVLAPASILTADRVRRAREHREALQVLVRVCDEGVQDRRITFLQQIAAAGMATSLPALRFLPSIRPVDGACLSCGDATEAPTWCWRCQLAARLALHGTVPVNWLPAAQPTLRGEDGSTVLAPATVLPVSAENTPVFCDQDGQDGQDGQNLGLGF